MVFDLHLEGKRDYLRQCLVGRRDSCCKGMEIRDGVLCREIRDAATLAGVPEKK